MILINFIIYFCTLYYIYILYIIFIYIICFSFQDSIFKIHKKRRRANRESNKSQQKRKIFKRKSGRFRSSILKECHLQMVCKILRKK